MVVSLFSPLIPDWEMAIAARNICRIRTVKMEELEPTRELVNTWARVYFTFPSGVSCGSEVIGTFVRSLDRGKVLVGEDSKGVAQVFSRVTLKNGREELYVEELFVAPWNDTALRGRSETAKSRDFLEIRKRELQGLATTHKISIGELTLSHKGTGTIMMLALCHLATHLKISLISLESNRQSIEFYRKIGMSLDSDEIIFSFNLSKGLPSELVKKVREYFLEHAA